MRNPPNANLAWIQRCAILTALCLAAIVGEVGPAAAQGAATATVPIRVDECRTEEGVTICLLMRGAEHQTTRPDGDAVYVSNLTYDFSRVGEGGELSKTSATVHNRVVWRAGEEVVVVRTAVSSYTAEGQSCHYHAVFVVAGGGPRVDHLGLSCTAA